uniref:Uncharacterized protein LOC104236031 n=1 Tax=Nicotiana sylvestris TaxID=4096 RepID=A0A1U7XET9_NICSY|nr:PREDICTED: uncharacterized protein LOC104236031 [Nicotiana sylvestris]XP_009788177.1 PREDICTED: uncharacterized protein LOC104236031 [Nicotiana sylvestris]
MQFHDHNKPHPHIEIMSDEQNQSDKVLTLEVHPPVIGSFPLVRKLPAASLHLTEWWIREAKDVMGEFSGEVTNMKVPILKFATHREVAPSEFSHRDGCFHTWNVPPSGFGKVRDTPGYWEWVEDVLPHHKFFLEDLKVYDAIYASLFTYDYNDNVLQAFCELWRPSTNILATFIGELSISLWDLRTIGDLPVHGSFNDEVVPLAKELIEMDHQAKPFLPESCLYLFSAFHRLAKGEFHEVSIHDWVGF